MQWLNSNLTDLKERGVRTIGIEREAIFNPFLWAYQDGTLSKNLGSDENARNYLRAIFREKYRQEFAANTQAETDLLIKAMDQGIRAVAYDSRSNLKMYQEFLAKPIAAWKQEIASSSSIAGVDLTEKQQTIRTNSDQLNEKSAGKSGGSWLVSEVDWVLGLKPEYATKHAALENTITLGHKKIAAGTLTSDALSATIFDAMAAPGKRLTIGGSAHMDGIGSYKQHLSPQHRRQVHGTFGVHLANICEAGKRRRLLVHTVLSVRWWQRLLLLGKWLV